MPAPIRSNFPKINRKDDYEITKEEIEKRMDLRHLDIVSVDPPGCKDIDDALHCVKLNNGNYQVGVHIAGLLFWVKNRRQPFCPPRRRD